MRDVPDKLRKRAERCPLTDSVLRTYDAGGYDSYEAMLEDLVRWLGSHADHLMHRLRGEGPPPPVAMMSAEQVERFREALASARQPTRRPILRAVCDDKDTGEGRR